jgi:cysteine desulfurase
MRIYLDHNATTPVRAEVVEVMTRVLRDGYGNPSSTHAEGAAARREMDQARERVASLLAVEPRELLFTGSATEANNTALLGVLAARGGGPAHVVSTAIEHPSVEASLEQLEADGVSVTRVGVGPGGRVDAAEVLDAIRTETALVSVIWANNETGVIQPVEAIAEGAREHGVPFHSDATQAIGKWRVDLGRVPCDLLSLSAHKFGGPKGSGCLVAREGIAFTPRLLGGPQEGRRRGGTENVAGVAGLAVACQLAEAELPERLTGYARLRDRLWKGIQKAIPRVHRNGSAEHLLPNTLNIEFESTAGEVLLQALDLEGVAVSAGAACASGSIDPSPILVAMGRSPEQARGSLRWSVGHGNDAAQIDRVLEVLPGLVERVRDAGAA